MVPDPIREDHRIGSCQARRAPASNAAAVEVTAGTSRPRHDRAERGGGTVHAGQQHREGRCRYRTRTASATGAKRGGSDRLIRLHDRPGPDGDWTVAFGAAYRRVLQVHRQVLSRKASPRTRLHSARLLPCAGSSSEQVVEGTHHIMAEGTGLEPYSPCQGLVRGQGGLEDVQACVDLAIHLPVAHQAHEHLAHPISAPGATHGAGLTGPCRVHFDDGHAFEGGLVFDLTMNLSPRPGGEAAIHPTGAAACAVECEVLEDNRGPSAFSELHESFRDSVQSLSDPMPLPLAFPIQQTTHDPSVPSLFPRKPPSSPEVGLLDCSDAVEREGRRDHPLAGCDHTIEGILVCVESDRRLWLVGSWRSAPDDEDNLARHNRERAEAPRRIAQERLMPFRKRQMKLCGFHRSNRNSKASGLRVEPIRLILRFEHELADIWG